MKLTLEQAVEALSIIVRFRKAAAKSGKSDTVIANELRALGARRKISRSSIRQYRTGSSPSGPTLKAMKRWVDSRS